jgi:GNAT superfamily N-acetyltransferase
MVVAVNQDISVRPLEENDRAGWELLWQGYQRHLRTKVPDKAVELTWMKLMDSETELFGLVAVFETFRMAGLVHFSLAPSSWSVGPMCHLQDLYVHEQMRGQGVGHALMDEVFHYADKAKASQVFWHINRANFRAKLLMDKYNVGPEGQLVQERRKLSR